MNFIRWPWRCERGSLMTEFAMVLPIIMLFGVGVIEIGRVMYTSSTIEEAAREAARFAVVRGATATKAATVGDIRDAVIENAPRLDAANMNVVVTYEPDNAPGSFVTVRVEYGYEFLIPATTIAPIVLSGASKMMIAR